MKRLLLVCLMMSCSVSWAEWEIAATSDSVSVYFDKTTIRKNGAIVKMWLLHDYLSSQDFMGKKYNSSKFYSVFDCKSEMFAVSSVVLYMGSMGEGSVIHNHTNKDKDLEWGPVVPNSDGFKFWKIACGRK